MTPVLAILPVGLAIGVVMLAPANEKAAAKKAEIENQKMSRSNLAPDSLAQPINIDSLAIPSTFGLNIGSDWTGIQFSKAWPAAHGQWFLGCDGTLDNSTIHLDSSFGSTKMKQIGTANASGMRARIGYEFWAKTGTPVILTVSASLEQSWISSETQLEVSRTQPDGIDGRTIESTSTKPTAKMELTETGPRLGFGIRLPSGFSRLNLKARMETGISWSVLEESSTNLRATEWKRIDPCWTIGADWDI